jgi:iron complex outermembrane receptor protein
MLKKNRLTVAVATAMGLGASALLPATASAQGEPMLEEVVVTGSRIARNPESYIGGMAIATSEDIERNVNNSVMDALLRVPTITSSNSTGRNNSNNASRGTNFVEIHNLEPERTLVLMDGRRVVSTIRDSSGLAVDMQSFPPNMVDRVEVLADGASAVYGSDAIAGVVNVILKNDFEGFEFTAAAGTPDDDGGESYSAGFLYGAQGARGGFVVGVDFTDTEGVDLQERSWSKDPILGRADDGAGGKLILFGSGVPPQGIAINSGLIFIDDPETGASVQDYDTFGFSGLNGSAGDGSLQSIKDTGHRYNYNDPGRRGSALVAPVESVNIGVTGNVELTSNWSAYTNILANHREGTLYFTPLPVTSASGRFTDLIQVPFSNPNLPADAAEAIRAAEGADAEAFQLWWRGADLGNREFEYDTDTMQATVGFMGDLDFGDKSWGVDTWATWGQSRLTEVTFGQINVANLQAAVDPAQCALISSCPKKENGDPLFDPFGRSPKTQEEIDFITFEDHEKTEYEMWHVAATLTTAELFSLPAGDVGFATGVEWRDESGSVTPSGIVANGDSGGNFAQATDGGYNLWEIYAEFEVPLITDAPLAEEVSMQAALRYSDYDDYDETTWKLGARWIPVSWLQLRAQASTGFRAPNVLELFGGNADSFTGVTDPCNAANQAANPVVRDNCASQGVPADFVQPAAQLKITQGGNPELEPETSENFSVGAVFAFETWGNPRVAIDYYDVEVEDAIGTPLESDVINTCYETPGLAAPECDRISRSAAGDVVRFDLLNENLATIETSGVDVNATAAWDTGIGVFTANWLLNWLNDYTQTTDTGVEDDRTGTVACDVCSYGGYPEIKSTFDLILSQDSWSTTLSWRYLDEMDVQDEIGFDEFTDTTDAVNYFDFLFTYGWDNISLTFVVENFTDEDPPYVPAISTNTSPIFDPLGRFYSLRFKWSI